MHEVHRNKGVKRQEISVGTCKKRAKACAVLKHLIINQHISKYSKMNEVALTLSIDIQTC